MGDEVTGGGLRGGDEGGGPPDGVADQGAIDGPGDRAGVDLGKAVGEEVVNSGDEGPVEEGKAVVGEVDHREVRPGKLEEEPRLLRQPVGPGIRSQHRRPTGRQPPHQGHV